ncbi:hypothetical protein PFISCL1PPCAC_27642, partial [Pristionchus fissidentatus]
ANMKLSLLLLVFALSIDAKEDSFEFRIPPVVPQAESYMCTSLQVNEATSIIGFDVLNENHVLHHLLLFGCEEPGSDEVVWDCGEMSAGSSTGMDRAPPCAAKPTILYAWAHDAPKLELPKDVAFKVGGDKSKIKHVVMQVHYMEDGEKEDESGVSIRFTDAPISKEASTMLLVTGGEIPPMSTESLETACTIDEDVVIHPFAYRTHTHALGASVSGWVVQEKDGVDSWTLLGRRDPQLPQMFVPVANSSLVIKKGDIVAARCMMVNEGPEVVSVGSSGKDEMCNLYVMYWSEGSQGLKDNTCFSPGAPNYYWSSEAQLNHIPN